MTPDDKITAIKALLPKRHAKLGAIAKRVQAGEVSFEGTLKERYAHMRDILDKIEVIVA